MTPYHQLTSQQQQPSKRKGLLPPIQRPSDRKPASNIQDLYSPNSVFAFSHEALLFLMPRISFPPRLKEPFAENLQKLNKVSADAFPDKTVDFRSMEQMIKESYNSIRVFSNATILAAVTMFFPPPWNVPIRNSRPTVRNSPLSKTASG